MSICIITDSNSGISQEESARLGIVVVPMPFYIDDKLYYEDIDLTREDFFLRQEKGAHITTSMPAVGEVMDIWRRELERADQIVYIPMSGSLSGSCAAAVLAAEDMFPGKVFVVDNQRISVTQRQSVLDALQMASEGMDGAQIKEILERTKAESSIYIAVDTLTHLKRGGRITPAAAAIGTLLRIKPVLQIQGGALDAYAKCRTARHARTTMLEAIEHDYSERFHFSDPQEAVIAAAHTCGKEEAEAWLDEVRQAWPGSDIHMDPLSLSIACHIGRGATAVTISRKLRIDAFKQR